MRELLTVLAMTSLSSGCVGITDLYRVPENVPKAQIRIAIEDGLHFLGSSGVKTKISDVTCSNKSSPPGGEVRPSPYNKSILSGSTNEERNAKSERMAQDEKAVLDFMNYSGIDKHADPSYLRYVFNIEANKVHVFHFEYIKEPGPSFRDFGEKCALIRTFRFEPNEVAEVRFRVLRHTTPASCQVLAVNLLGKSHEAVAVPKIAEEFRGCP